MEIVGRRTIDERDALAVGRAIMQAYADPADNPGQCRHMVLGKDKLAELTRYATEGTAWQKNIATGPIGRSCGRQRLGASPASP